MAAALNIRANAPDAAILRAHTQSMVPLATRMLTEFLFFSDGVVHFI